MSKKGFSRRKFLTAVSVSAGTIATSGLTGCGGSDGPNAQFIPGAPPPPPQIVNGEAFYPQSIASGDPKPDSVILWTRVDAGGADAELRLEVATDEGFNNLVVVASFTAPGSHDNCLKVRVTDLASDTRYYYRFLYLADGNFQASRTGRTQTAPHPESTRAVRFGQVSCQDPIGRYYNTYLRLLEEDLDFIVHLGDYIYETTGNPEFQDSGGERDIQFTAPDEALTIGSGENSFLAAQSVGNYRDLYKAVKSDEVMQRIHERFSMIAIWDDHEFSDDQWQANGTYLDGRASELSEQRKRNAEQVYFEYMPIDPFGGEAGAFFNEGNRFPTTRIYRDFHFGANVHMLCTDYRTFRPDHLIPEDAFPGTIAVTEQQLTVLLAAQGIDFADIRDSFAPYVNVDAQPQASLKPILVGVATQAYLGEGLTEAEAAAKAQEVISGNIATMVFNGLLAAYNNTVPPIEQAPLLGDELIANAPRGIAFFSMGKQSLLSSLGARYFVVKDTYDLYAAARLAFEGPDTQSALGQDQDIWLRTRLMNSNARWKLVANSVSNTSLILDLSNPMLGVPEPFNQRFYLNVDQWDGFPNQRAEYLNNVYGPASGVVLLAGDIHASFVTDHGQGTVEFTTSSVSSGTLGSIIARQAAADPTLAELAPPVLPFIDLILASGSPGIEHLQSSRNGVSVIEASTDRLVARYFELDESNAFVNRYDDSEDVLAEMVETAFEVTESGLNRLV